MAVGPVGDANEEGLASSSPYGHVSGHCNNLILNFVAERHKHNIDIHRSSSRFPLKSYKDNPTSSWMASVAAVRMCSLSLASSCAQQDPSNTDGIGVGRGYINCIAKVSWRPFYVTLCEGGSQLNCKYSELSLFQFWRCLRNKVVLRFPPSH